MCLEIVIRFLDPREPVDIDAGHHAHKRPFYPDDAGGSPKRIPWIALGVVYVHMVIDDVGGVRLHASAQNCPADNMGRTAKRHHECFVEHAEPEEAVVFVQSGQTRAGHFHHPPSPPMVNWSPVRKVKGSAGNPIFSW